MNNNYITSKEAASILHISPKTLIKWRAKGYKLPHYKNMETNRVFYKKNEVEDYFEKQLNRVETIDNIVSRMKIPISSSSIQDAIEMRFSS